MLVDHHCHLDFPQLVGRPRGHPRARQGCGRRRDGDDLDAHPPAADAARHRAGARQHLLLGRHASAQRGRGARHPGGRDRAPCAAPESRRHRRGGARLLLQALVARSAGGRLPPATSRRRGAPGCRSRSTRATPTTTRSPSSRTSTPKGAFPAILHCYTGGPKLATRAVELGLYVSFTGVVTFKKSEALRDIAREVPLDRLLVETDAPVPGAGALSRQDQRAVLRRAYGGDAGRGEGRLAGRDRRGDDRQLLPPVPQGEAPGAARCRRRMSYRATILGCGSSGGVPRIGTMWGACDPSNPKNRRPRCSALIERIGKPRHTTVLIDTSPDLREQLLERALRGARRRALHARPRRPHARHRRPAHGLLRHEASASTCGSTSRRGKASSSASPTASRSRPGSTYPPILNAASRSRRRRRSRRRAVGASSRSCRSRRCTATSARSAFASAASPIRPTSAISRSPRAAACRTSMCGSSMRCASPPHPSHFSVKQALDWIERLKPKRAILTHMTTDLDYEALRRELPDGVEPAYDTWSSSSIEFA